jgi:hypothetical protein
MRPGFFVFNLELEYGAPQRTIDLTKAGAHGTPYRLRTFNSF